MDAFLGSAAVCVGAYGSCVGAYGSCLKMGASCLSQLASLTFQHFWALDGRVWPRKSATPKRMFRATTRTQPWQQRLDWKKRMWRLYGRSRDNEMATRKIKNGSAAVTKFGKKSARLCGQSWTERKTQFLSTNSDQYQWCLSPSICVDKSQDLKREKWEKSRV